MNTARPFQAPQTPKLSDDPELTREILFYCARNRDGKPGRITLDELEQTFARISRDILNGHIAHAIEAELLQVDDILARRVGRSDGKIRHDLLDVKISGLTTKGRAYVKRARTPEWRQSLNGLRKSGQEATTATLVQSLLTGAEAGR